MDNNWDLFSMLKAYNSLSSASISSSTSTTATPICNRDMTHMGDPLFSSVPMSFTFSDPSLATTACGITTANSMGNISIGQSQGFLSNKQIQQNSQMQPQQMNISKQVESAFLGSSLRVRETNPQGIQPRRYQRNNQPIMVEEMTKEQLAIGDSWMWRKYGQKPIKGSPHSRSYYKCKSFEGCAARKYVEKSSKNPSLFVVSYVGQHTHAQSISRNCVPKRTSYKLNNDSNITHLPKVDSNFSSSSSSMVLGSDTSQNTIIEEGQNVGQKETEKVLVEDGDNDENILLPNFVMAEDILKGFEELSGVDNGFAHSSGFLPQSWIPSRTTSISTTTTTTFNGNGSVDELVQTHPYGHLQ